MNFNFHLDSPWLIADFDVPQRMLSWSVTHPGFVEADQVAWLQVRDADLNQDTDPVAFLRNKMTDMGLENAVGLMTSRDVQHHHFQYAGIGKVNAGCLTTLGLHNASHAGFPEAGSDTTGPGTINSLCHVDVPLTDAAMVEAVSIIAQARTAAMLHKGDGNNAQQVSGTGTDCIVLACPPKGEPSPYAGLHTDAGKALGQAVFRATLDARDEWLDKHGAPGSRAARVDTP